MVRLNAHLGYQFTELPFLERFGAAAASGFTAVEFPAPYEYAPEVIAHELARHKLTLVQVAAPMGNPGEKGFAACNNRGLEFRNSVELAIEYARALDCTSVHLMSGAYPAGDALIDRWRTYLDNVRYVANLLSDHGITPLIEVISQHTVPGYFMSSYAMFESLLEAAPEGGLKLIFDTYHAHSISGDFLNTESPLVS